MAAASFATTVLDGAERDEPKRLEALCAGRADLLVVDHYGKDQAFETSCRSFARTVVVFDDCTGRKHDCDVLIDAAVSDSASYENLVPAHTRLLLGPAYAMVRRDLLAKRPAALKRRGEPVKNILVSFGATDGANMTPRVLDALADIADVSIAVALSARAPHLEDVRSRVRGKARLVLDADMAELMTEADLAIGAAGSSAFERAALGLASIIVTVADNQKGIAGLLARADAAIDIGATDSEFANRLRSEVKALSADTQKRTRMAEAASALIDGRGARRIRVALSGTATLTGGARVSLRLAEAADEKWLLDLQKIPETRRYARNAAVPTAAEHAAWMKRTLENPDVLLMIVDVNGEPAGMLRLDKRKASARSFEVSIAVLPAFQGRGVAVASLNLGRALCVDARIDASVLPQNTASQALFRRAGYQQMSDDLFSIIPATAKTGRHNAA